LTLAPTDAPSVKKWPPALPYKRQLTFAGGTANRTHQPIDLAHRRFSCFGQLETVA
jgi:hypothetical protein